MFTPHLNILLLYILISDETPEGARLLPLRMINGAPSPL